VLGYGIVLGVAVLTTLVWTPLVRWFALRYGIVSQPSDDRHVHTEPTPTAGGAAMFVGFLAAMVVASRLDQFQEIFRDNSEPLGVLLAGAVMFVVGAVDDLRDVSPPAKLAGMVLAASLLAAFGVTMFYLRVPFGLFDTDVLVLSADLGPLVTVLWVVLMANAINLIDGLDGLAAGIVMIAGSALFLFSDRLFDAGYLEGSNIGPLVAIIAVGVAGGFLPYNFNPARIFMGDAGAMFLGLLLAVTTITVGGRTDIEFSGNTYFFFAPLVIPILILGVPIVDTVFSVARRLVRRQRWHVADAGHLHHRLVRLGHGPRRTVVILWCWTALLSGVALLPTYTNQGNALVPFAIAALALLLYALLHPGVRAARASQSAAAHPSGADPVAPVPGAGNLAVPSEEAAALPGEGEVVDLAARRRRQA